MIPTNSSGQSNGCDNISSNCVIWQGPDIDCIDLCNGDTISEVTAKIAQKVCDIIKDGVTANPSLAGLDLTCLNIPGQTPTTLVPVLQAMVNAICDKRSAAPRPGGTTELPIMQLPACLQYTDVNGNLVTELRLDEFASLIATQVCTNLASINLINSTLTSLDSRVTILEACVLPCTGAVAEVQIVPTCVSTVGVLTNVSTVVLALEQEFCLLRDAVGTTALISQAISQTTIQGSSNTLCDSSVSYGSILGWSNNPPTLAQSLQNAWVVIDDLYCALAAVQQNCCPTGCDSVVFASSQSVQYDMVTGLVSSILFDFTGSSIPAAFNDCPGRSLITLTDASGSSLTQIVSVSTLQSQASGATVSTGSLNTTDNITVTIDYCVTNGTDNCELRTVDTIPGFLPCPLNVSMSNIKQDEATVNFSNALGTTAQYVLTLYDGAAVAATHTVANPGATVSHTFTGLTPGTNYELEIKVVYNGAEKICPRETFTTQTASAPCSQGMDVAFVIDYTGSMSADISDVKSGMAAIANTIATSSGSNNYRLGLITADMGHNPPYRVVPTYNACTDYVNLPAAQKVNNTSAGTGSGGNLFITAWEMFNNNNDAAFITQLNKLDGGVNGTCIDLGQGSGTPEPTDYAASLVMNQDFLGAFRNNVAKYIVIVTDALPSFTGDEFNASTWAGIQALIVQANSMGVKFFVVGKGVDIQGNDAGQTGGPIVTPLYPWRELATQTGGGFDVDVSGTAISNLIIAGC